MSDAAADRFPVEYRKAQGLISNAEMGARLGVTRQRAQQLARKFGVILPTEHQLDVIRTLVELARYPDRTNETVAFIVSVPTTLVAKVRRDFGIRRPKDLPDHGDVRRYGRGCRCVACKAANAKEAREYRISRDIQRATEGEG